MAGITAIALVGFGGWFANQKPSMHRCTAQLSIATVDGISYRLQDQGPPGRERCDGVMFDISNPRMVATDGVFAAGYLGFDCKVHSPDGSTSPTITTPNRADGLCGQADWPR